MILLTTNQSELTIFAIMSEEKQILSLIEVMELLTVSRKTLDNWNDNKILKRKKIGGKIYYKRTDINNLLK